VKPKSKTPKYMADYKRKYRKQQKKLKKLQKKQDKLSTEDLDTTKESDHFDYDTEYAETVNQNLPKIEKFAYDWLMEERQKRMQATSEQIAPFTYIINAVDDELFSHPKQRKFLDYNGNTVMPQKHFLELTEGMLKAPLFWLRELVLSTLIKKHVENPEASPFWRLGNVEDHEELLFELDEMTRNNLNVLEGKQK
jgi:hypothetical protein